MDVMNAMFLLVYGVILLCGCFLLLLLFLSALFLGVVLVRKISELALTEEDPSGEWENGTSFEEVVWGRRKKKRRRRRFSFFKRNE
jgi:hypothetical protein